MQIELHHPRAADLVGFIPSFLSDADPRPAAEQFNERYAHGGGWCPFGPWDLDPKTHKLQYTGEPGDPPYTPRATITLRDEKIIVYDHAWVCIVQADGKFEVARMD